MIRAPLPGGRVSVPPMGASVIVHGGNMAFRRTRRALTRWSRDCTITVPWLQAAGRDRDANVLTRRLPR
jgi:hypothetical protein